MPTELADEYFRRHKKSQEQVGEEWHPSYREYWNINPCATQWPNLVREHVIDDYFANQHSTLWGRAWYIGPGGNVEVAKEWLAGVLGELGIEVVE